MLSSDSAIIKEKSNNKSPFLYELQRWALLIFTIMVFILFSLLEPAFFSTNNFLVILRQSAITGLLALGLTAIIVAGEFDLSIASIATLTGSTGLVLFSKGWAILPVIIVILLIGIALELINVVIILRLKVPAFVATLGMSGLVTGLARMITGGTTFFPLKIPSSAVFIGRGFIFDVIPFQVVILIIASLLVGYILESSYFGRHMYATGGNRIAAEHVGIRTDHMKILAFALAGALAVVAGLTTTTMLSAANAESCAGFQFPAITAAFMGGVFLKGGQPNIWGTIVASILMAMLANGFVMLSFPQYLKEIVHGLILLTAVSLVTVTRRNN